MISAINLLIATLGGAAIGLEREWSGHASGPGARFGGIRTFTLLGAVGGIAGGLLTAGWTSVAAIIVAAAATLVAIGYAASSRQDIDATTEVAAIVAIAAGVIAGVGQTQLASAIIAATTLLLLEKGRLHGMVARIDDRTLRASARFAVLALVILPLLPVGPYGPYDAVRPRELWALVLFFSGLSFAAWIARRLLGATHGTVVAGMLGGIISSTSVTLAFSRSSRTRPDGVALALGSVGACTVMLARVAAASAILNWEVAKPFVLYVWPAFVIGGVALTPVMRLRTPSSATMEEDSPLQLRAALQMMALFQVVMVIVSAVLAWASITALLLTSALIGLTDLDALTLSLARNHGGLDPSLAARALAVGVLANTLLKLTVAAVIGRGMYRQIVVGTLGAMALAGAALLWALG